MQHLFLNKTLSLIAKEKGFDEPCFARYIKDEFRYGALGGVTNFTKEQSNQLSAPLHQQIIDWLREVKNLDVSVFIMTKTWTIDINDLSEAGWLRSDGTVRQTPRRAFFGDLVEYKDYYQALAKAIEEAFKLI